MKFTEYLYLFNTFSFHYCALAFVVKYLFSHCVYDFIISLLLMNMSFVTYIIYMKLEESGHNDST